MGFLTIIASLIEGVIVLLLIGVFIYGFYYLLKKIKLIDFIFNYFIKVPDEIYEDASKFIVEKKPFIEFAGYISKFEHSLQRKYIKAYFKLKKLNLKQEVKNG